MLWGAVRCCEVLRIPIAAEAKLSRHLGHFLEFLRYFIAKVVKSVESQKKERKENEKSL